MSDLSVKRQQIRNAVRLAVSKGKAEAGSIVATAKRVSLADLFEEEQEIKVKGWNITELFDIKQGVTWGGSECEPIYLVDKCTAGDLEKDMVRKTLGGRDIKAWGIKWQGNFLVFPYTPSSSGWIPAFQNSKLGGNDALDFSVNLYSAEKGKNILERLNYRIAQGIVTYPKTATYLVKFFDKLSQREFEGKTLSEYNKSWYEYHRPREPSIASFPKIVCKRVMKDPAFALDEEGFLPKDSAIALLPKKRLREVGQQLEKVLSQPIPKKIVFRYILAFLNSDLFKKLLIKRRSKKRGGYPIVDESMLKKVIIPFPLHQHATIIKRILKENPVEIDAEEIIKLNEKILVPEKLTLMSF